MCLPDLQSLYTIKSKWQVNYMNLMRCLLPGTCNNKTFRRETFPIHLPLQTYIWADRLNINVTRRLWQHRNLSKSNLNLNSCKNVSIHNIFLSYLIILKLCTEHSCHTAVICVKFQNNWISGNTCYGPTTLHKIEFESYLTHWGLVTPFGDIDLGQHWLR